MTNTESTITFVERYQPALAPGTYDITVTQTVTGTDPQSGPIDDGAPSTSARFAVAGARFTLSPSDVAGYFPPAGSQGQYAEVLPHIVVSRRTLLWERSPDVSAGAPSGATPWLAVLLLTAADPPPAVQTVQLGDLARDTFVTDSGTGATRPSSLPADTVSYADAWAQSGGTMTLEVGQSWSDSCQVIDVPLDLFGGIAPTVGDLGFLGSARTVPLDAKPGAPTDATTTYSVAIGNRPVPANTPCTAHLISLEAMAPFLPAGSPVAPASPSVDGVAATAVRLVTLTSWSFISQDPAQTFEQLLLGLDVSALQRTPPTGLAASDAAAVVATAFGLGYTALDHSLRQGNTTVSWYRGPFVPYATASGSGVTGPTDALGSPVATADQLVRYDPTTGMMDTSYASAWTLGRLLGMATTSFAVALGAWRAANLSAVNASALYSAVSERWSQAIELPPTNADAGSLRRAAMGFLVDKVASVVGGDLP